MTNKQITDLTPATSLNGIDEIEISQGGNSKSASLTLLLSFINALNNPMTAAGDLIVGGTSGAPQRLAIGANGKVLGVSAGALTWVDQTGGGGGSSAPTNALPSVPWFAPSGNTVVAPTTGQPAGDPFVVWDASANLYRMFYFRNPSGSVAIYSITAPTLAGPWSSEATVSGLSNYHKFVILVDAYGNPVQIGGNYHGYAVYYDGTNLDSKTIYHMTASSLGGSWTVASNVVPKGASGSWDGFANDACYALYDNGTIYLWYMAEPDTSQSDFGLSSRMMVATSTTPDSGFTKNYSTAVLTPGSSGAWDAGWIGGMQIRKMSEKDPYVMFYNAGNTIPSSAGQEPNTSLVGVAYATSLAGPWTKMSNNPILTLSNITSDAVENWDIWRPHVAYDPQMNRWTLFYNTGIASAHGEMVTYARANVYGYQYYPNPSSGGQILTLTTSEQQVPNSMVNVQPGVYRVQAQINLMGDSTGSSPHLNIDTFVRTGGSTHVFQSREFIGNFAYENRDTVIDCIVEINAPTYIDLSEQVTSGTPTSNTYARNLRINVERIR